MSDVVIVRVNLILHRETARNTSRRNIYFKSIDVYIGGGQAK